MSFMTSLLGGGGGGAAADAEGGGGGGGAGNFISQMGTGFVNGRLGPGNGFTGTGTDPLSSLFSSMINSNGQQGNASAESLPPTNFPGATPVTPPNVSDLTPLQLQMNNYRQ